MFYLEVFLYFCSQILNNMRRNYIIENDVCKKYLEFLKEKFQSDRTIRNYLIFVNSSLVLRYIKEIANTDSIYKIDDFNVLLRLYLAIKEDKDNIRLHRVYSSAVSKFVKFRFPDKKMRKLY